MYYETSGMFVMRYARNAVIWWGAHNGIDDSQLYEDPHSNTAASTILSRGAIVSNTLPSMQMSAMPPLGVFTATTWHARHAAVILRSATVPVVKSHGSAHSASVAVMTESIVAYFPRRRAPHAVATIQ